MDGQLVALIILNEVLTKLPDAFSDQFSRLGLPMHISNLAGPPKNVTEQTSVATNVEETDGNNGPTTSLHVRVVFVLYRSKCKYETIIFEEQASI